MAGCVWHRMCEVLDCQDFRKAKDQAMRVLGKSQSGQIVGYFERCSLQANNLLAFHLDAYLQPVEQTNLEGFRESMAWLYVLGAVQFECLAVRVPRECMEWGSRSDALPGREFGSGRGSTVSSRCVVT